MSVYFRATATRRGTGLMAVFIRCTAPSGSTDTFC